MSQLHQAGRSFISVGEISFSPLPSAEMGITVPRSKALPKALVNEVFLPAPFFKIKIGAVSDAASLSAVFPYIARMSQNDPGDVSTCYGEAGGVKLDFLCCSC